MIEHDRALTLGRGRQRSLFGALLLRASVTRNLLLTRVKNGILGSFEFDANGDTTEGGVRCTASRRASRASLM
ncbi:MAG: hypothetical protein ABWY97_03735 [Thermoleophilaceae bacterium]